MPPLDKIANKRIDEENKFFENQSDSEDIFQLKLIGNKSTWNQIEDWKSPSVQKMKDRFKNWDGKSPLNFEISDGGEVRKFDDLLDGENVPEELPEIGQMILYKSAKITDFISGSFLAQYGLIVSGKVKSLLQDFNLGEHQYYPLEIKHKNHLQNDYWFLRSSSSVDDYIDYEKSNFYTQQGSFGFQSREPVGLNSKEEITEYRLKIKDKRIIIRASEIHLSSNFPGFDLFYSKGFGILGTFVSAKLKSELKGFTGIEIKTTKRLKKWYS